MAHNSFINEHSRHPDDYLNGGLSKSIQARRQLPSFRSKLCNQLRQFYELGFDYSDHEWPSRVPALRCSFNTKGYDRCRYNFHSDPTTIVTGNNTASTKQVDAVSPVWINFECAFEFARFLKKPVSSVSQVFRKPFFLKLDARNWCPPQTICFRHFVSFRLTFRYVFKLYTYIFATYVIQETLLENLLVLINFEKRISLSIVLNRVPLQKKLTTRSK